MIAIWLKHLMLERSISSLLDHAAQQLNPVIPGFPDTGHMLDKVRWITQHGHDGIRWVYGDNGIEPVIGFDPSDVHVRYHNNVTGEIVDYRIERRE